MKLSITIPAYNEENRIGRTLKTYLQYFDKLQADGALAYELIIVPNGCRDNTVGVVKDIAGDRSNVIIVDLKERAGKGLAIQEGFKNALTRDNDLIGFVDADMATKPEYFYDLVKNIGQDDAIIASRYMPGSDISPPRPWIKKWGRRIIYDSLLRLLLGLKFYDTQCGAKLFKRQVIEKIVDKLTVKQWAFDVELLYLCKINHFTVKELPTTWEDQDESKLDIMAGGMPMLSALFAIRREHR